MTNFPISETELVAVAVGQADQVRGRTSPNPWVGAALACKSGQVFVGATEPPPGRHAEVVAIEAAVQAGVDTTGATLATTLEPCNHQGRTGPCSMAIISAAISRVIVGLEDPDPLVAGSGIERLQSQGVEVTQAGAEDRARIADQLAPYLHHRRTGRPWVVLKLAATLDGGTAAPDRTSQWITGPEARLDVHRLRAQSDAILVGAGTVRDDDPSLTVRLPAGDPLAGNDPQRVVLGTAPPAARVHPCIEEAGPLEEVLERLAAKGVIQLMVEGGATTAAAFHQAGLVDQYVFYLAPAMFGGADHRGLFDGAGAPTITDLWRGEITSVTNVGADLRIDLAPRAGSSAHDLPGPQPVLLSKLNPLTNLLQGDES